MEETQKLAGLPVFSGLSDADLSTLAGLMRERYYPRGCTIFEVGDPSETAYFVAEGRVKIFRLSSDGTEQILGLFGPGAPFGLITAIDDRPYPASAQTTEDTRVWAIRSQDLRRLMNDRPHLSVKLLQEVGHRLRQAQGRVHALSVQTVHQRLATYLLELARERGCPGTEAVTVQLTMTHQELGGYLGASRETVTRALADLRRERVVTVTANDGLTLVPARLEAWLEER